MSSRVNIIGLFVVIIMLASCSSRSRKMVIGLSLDEVSTEQSYNYLAIFKRKIIEQGGRPLVRSAGGSHERQLMQVKAMIKTGITILVLKPVNTVRAAEIVDLAKSHGIKVIAYDKMVSKSKVDYFITYDYKRTGQMQATSMLEMRPTGNYALLNGNARTRNAFLLHEGQRSVLHASIKHKNICLVLDTMVAGATNDDGYNLAKYLINKVKDSIDIIITSNDAMAGGVVRALQESVGSDGLSLAERVLVSGVDADSRALRRINRGLQSTSVYNSVKTAATASARAAVLLASGTLTNDKTSVYVNNGLKNVPTLILPSILISNNNLFLVKSD